MLVYDVHIFYYFSIYWSDTSLGSRLQADELFGGYSYADSAEPGQTTKNSVSDQAVYSLLSQCTF